VADRELKNKVVVITGASCETLDSRAVAVPLDVTQEADVANPARRAVEQFGEIRIFNLAHHFFPGTVEAMMARQTRKAEFDNAPAGAKTSGSLHEREPAGAGIRGGWKKQYG
jgi:hypothetical protein